MTLIENHQFLFNHRESLVSFNADKQMFVPLYMLRNKLSSWTTFLEQGVNVYNQYIYINQISAWGNIARYLRAY